MEVEKEQPVQDKLRLYCVGSAELNQFYIPYNEDKQRPSHSRRPLCLSEIKEFLIIDEDSVERKESIIPNPLLNEKIVGVACGGTFTVINTASGRVYSWGSNDQGALGRDGNQTIPLPVELQAPIDTVSAGDAHSIFASKVNGMIYFAGVYKGILKGFLGEIAKKPILLTIDDLTVKSKKDIQLKKIISGSNHTLLLTSDSVYIRGDSEYFASGRRIMERRKEKYDPVKFQAMGIKHAVDIFTGGMHCFVKTVNNRYYGWGNNAFGQLGIGSREHQKVAVEIEYFREMDLTKIVGGEHHTLFLTAEGEVFACGRNDNGQLGLGEDLEEDHDPIRRSRAIKKVTLVPEHNTPVPSPQPAQTQEFDAQHLGELLNINFIWYPRKLELENIINITAGTHTSYAVGNEKTAHQLYSWGMAQNYILITGSSQEEKYTPYSVLPKIINFEIIRDISVSAQHLAYLSTSNKDLEVKVDESIFSKYQLPQYRHILAKKGKIIGKYH